jgi:hypothetical protein
VDHREAQLHQEIVHTRQAIDHKLTLLEQWGAHTMHRTLSRMTDVIEHSLVANARWVQETRDRIVVLMAQYPWVIVASGVLLGYCLRHQGAAQSPHAMLDGARCYEATPESTLRHSRRNSSPNGGD